MTRSGKTERRPELSSRLSDAARDVTDPFTQLYERWFHDVCRWLRAMGVEVADLEDVAQEVFLVVRKKLAAFDGKNPAAWLFQIALRRAREHRRRAWVRSLVRRRDVALDEIGDAGLGPEALAEQKEAQRLARRVLVEMSEKRRTAFVLFEVEGYTAAEIARLQDLPEATVRTRLFHARREFTERLARLESRRRKP